MALIHLQGLAELSSEAQTLSLYLLVSYYKQFVMSVVGPLKMKSFWEMLRCLLPSVVPRTQITHRKINRSLRHHNVILSLVGVLHQQSFLWLLQEPADLFQWHRKAQCSRPQCLWSCYSSEVSELSLWVIQLSSPLVLHAAKDSGLTLKRRPRVVSRSVLYKQFPIDFK